MTLLALALIAAAGYALLCALSPFRTRPDGQRQLRRGRRAWNAWTHTRHNGAR